LLIKISWKAYQTNT